jgi:uncharacterized membrane protein
MQAVILAVLCGLFYSSFGVFAGLAGGRIDGWLAASLYNASGTLVPMAVFLFSSAKKTVTGHGLLYANLAGVSIMFFSILLARLFSTGGNLAFVLPAVYGGVIVFGACFGWLVLSERINLLQLIGLVLVTAGVVCVVLGKLRTGQVS